MLNRRILFSGWVFWAAACVFRPAAANVVINEFMASNESTLQDANGAYSDWIELYNGAISNIDLTGWHLTDDRNDLVKWTFPTTNLAGGAYLIVFASGTNAVFNGELHANFKLTSSGEYLGLVAPDGTNIVHEYAPAFPSQLSDVSYGLGATNDNRYFTNATPGAANAIGALEFSIDPDFNPGRGYYSNSVSVTLTSATAGVTIYYTTDGSRPGPGNGTVYAGPILLNKTTPLRAVATHPSLYPSKVVSHTYLFLDDVVLQPFTPPGYPTVWGSRAADYEMDPKIVASPTYGPKVKPALKTHPVMALAMDINDMFGPGGIYANPQSAGDAWERPVSVELFDFPHGKEKQLDAGIRITGKASRSPDRGKHNMRLVFRNQYSESRLKFRLFENTDIEEYNSVVLRGGNGDSWINPATFLRAQYIRDQWQRDTQVDMGNETANQGHVHLYINGLYWGLYHTIERIEDDFLESHYGGNDQDYDANKDLSGGSAVEVIDGSNTDWLDVIAIAGAGLATEAGYSNIQAQVDLDNMIDYLMLNFYIVNDDWDHNRVTPTDP